MSDIATPFEVFGLGDAPPAQPQVFQKLCATLKHLAPPELVLDKESLTLRKFFDKYGSSKGNIAIFNHWIEKVLINQIKPYVTKTHTIVFKNIRVEKPTYTRGGEALALFPRMAQDRGYSYMGNIVAEIDYIYAPGQQPQKLKGGTQRRILGQIPIMLGSNYCHLNGLTDDQKIEIGECPNDPLGYFVIGGTARVITIQEKLRISLNLTFLDPDGNIETRMTCATAVGTTVTSLIVGKKFQSLKVGLHHMKREHHIPLYIAYFIVRTRPALYAHVLSTGQLMRYSDGVCDSLTRMILSFCKEETHGQVFNSLQASIDKAKYNISSIVKYIGGKRKFTQEMIADIPTSYVRIYNDVMTDLFGHIGFDPAYLRYDHVTDDEKDTVLDYKGRHLALMAANTINYLLGNRAVDDRDSWGNKRLDTAARSMEQLFNGFWNRAISTETSVASGVNFVPTVSTNFIPAFQPNNWGIPGFHHRENITDTLKRETPMAVYSQIGRVNTPSARKAKQTSIRMIQPSQLGICCLVGSSLVTCSDGIHSEPIEYLKADDTVMTASITSLAQEESGIYRWFSKMPKRVLNIRLISGRSVSCDPDHPILVVGVDGKSGWVLAGNIEPEMSLVVKHAVVPLSQAGMCPEFLLTKQDEFVRQVGYLLRNGASGDVRMDLEHVCYTTDLEWVSKLSQHLKRELVSGFLQCDTSCNSHHAFFISGLLEALGIEAHVVLSSDAYPLLQVDEDPKNLKLFYDLVHPAFKGYNHRLLSEIEHVYAQVNGNLRITSSDIFRYSAVNGHLLIPVESITEMTPEPVYDFTTRSENHSFYANGILVSNCPSETPEGENLGLLKNLSLTAVVSMERDPTEGIIQILEGLIQFPLGADLSRVVDFVATLPPGPAPPGKTVATTIDYIYTALRGLNAANPDREKMPLEHIISVYYQPGWIPVMLSGILYLWCCPPLEGAPKDILGRGRSPFELILLDCRRRGMLPYDSCIFYNTTDNILEYFCDGGRPCRPLFIVDEDEQLHIDKIDGWDLSVEDMLKSHCVEFVDAREQDYVMLAMYTHMVRDRYKRKKVLSELIPKMDSATAAAIAVAKAEVQKFLPELRNITNQLGAVLFDYFKAVEIFRKTEFDGDTFVEGIERAVNTFYKTLATLVIKNVLQQDALNYEKIVAQANNNASRSVLGTIDVHKRENKIDAKKLPKHGITDDLTSTVPVPELVLDIDALADHVKRQFLDEKQALDKCIPFSHSEIDPVAILGIAGSLQPEPECGQGPRSTYQASMCKQALGFYHYNHHLKFDTSFKIMLNPSRPMFETITGEVTGLNTAPTGTTPICAFLALSDNNEDAVVLKKEFDECSNLDVVKFSTYKTTCKTFTTASSDSTLRTHVSERFEKPAYKRGEPATRYEALDDRGFPKLDVYIAQGDAIIGKVRQDGGKLTNISITAGVGGGGFVDRILITKNAKDELMVKVKLRHTRKHVSGDKIASRYAQKGTVSRIIPEKHLPTIIGGINHGLVPDFFLNPHSILSRMTCNKLKEEKSTKGGVYTGTRRDATAFHPFDFDEATDTLLKLGMNPHGDERMMLETGKILEDLVFVAPCYYQCLRHHVKDKVQMRGRGSIKPLNHQPVGGRENQGGIRFGEMERDGLISHGCTGLVQERLMKVSDAYRTVFCSVCGNLAVVDISTSKFACKVCVYESVGPDKSHFVSKEIPYVLKLMFHMLLALGINVTLKFRKPDVQLSPENQKFIDALV